MRVRAGFGTLVVVCLLAGAAASPPSAARVGTTTAAAPASAAQRATPTFVWTGGSAVGSGDGRVSSAGNWAGGVAPATGQRVRLVFPALDCVAEGVCEQVVNDVPDLVVESLRVTTPRRTPVMYWYPDGYALTGLGLRLVGPLVSTGERNSEAFVPGLGLWLPLDLGQRARRWRVSDAPVYVGDIVGKALTVRTRRGGGVNVQRSIATDRYLEHGNGSAEVFGGSVNTRTRGQVTYRRTDVNLIDARLGSLSTHRVRLTLTSAGEPNRALGPVRLDDRTVIEMQAATAAHPLLKAAGPLDLGGVRLKGSVDCTDAEKGEPFTVLRGTRLLGRLSDAQGRPVPNGAILANLTTYDWCDHVVRVGYTRRSVTFTLLDAP
ncbi:hypothetical protein [Nocardioides sp.]|uniref:hypothetical protein n=1 Tax=Nocardioides sp. TaxID=35761 RepID=UPI001A19F8A2|nr:hypothetical protein [Nocardioides sp.]MBJ7356329.1 hypothetical protein [Nocardioides sp.]